MTDGAAAAPTRRALLASSAAAAAAPLVVRAAGAQVDGPALQAAGAQGGTSVRGPLRVAPGNPRYFAAVDGRRPLLLAGSHTWTSLQDFSDPPAPFGFDRFLDLLAEGGHSATRLWRREGSRNGRGQPISPLPWLRTGPGAALDGLPRFDLSRHDPAFFDRLRERVRACAARGVVPIVMLFDGWGMEAHDLGDPWPWHPCNAANNVNGIDGDPDRQGHGRLLASLRLPAALAVQERFVRRCVAALADCDALLWEVANEVRLTPDSVAWTRHMVRLIRGSAQEGMPHRHPVGVTAPYPDRLVPDAAMLAFTAESGADWISPHGWNRYQHDPPEATGRQVSIVDTDHTFGVGGDAAWVWKQVTRGHNVLVMDSLAGRAEIPGRTMPLPRLAAEEDSARRGVAGARMALARLDLARAVPAGGLSSTGYALAWPGRRWLVFAPEGEPVILDLSAAAGRRLRARWLEVERPERGFLPGAGVVEGGGRAVVPAADIRGPAALLLEVRATA